jgi:cyclin-dependent kinase 7
MRASSHSQGKPPTGIEVQALREIKYLQELRHDNLIILLDVFKEGKSICLVMDVMGCHGFVDLKQVIDCGPQRVVLDAAHIKGFMRMMLEGVGFLHRSWVCDEAPEFLWIYALV